MGIAHAAPSPNVLMIVVDDLNDWVGPLRGHPQVKTPHLDQLAARGMVFTQAHCQAPLCNPSRTSVLTGLRPSTTGIYGLLPYFREVNNLAEHVTLPQSLRKGGYHTVSVGKVYHGGGQHLKNEFDVVVPAPGYKSKPRPPLVPGLSHPAMDWGVYVENDEDQPDWKVADATIEQISRMDAAKPWFIACGFALPHVPCYASQKWFDLYPIGEVQLPQIKEDDRADLPRFADYLAWRLPEPRLGTLRARHQHEPLVRSYLATISLVDSQIGRVLQALKDSGQEENTMVVLWGDNGWHLGEKGITGKNTLWERSTKVPFIWAGPGIQRGAVCSHPVELLDIFPTLTDSLKLPPNAGLEGQSLVPQLRDPLAKRTRPAITTHNHHNHAVRTEQWRYILYADGSEELYDHHRDPHEWENLAKDERYVAVKTELAQWLPKQNLAPVPGSAHRLLTYDPVSKQATWEGEIIPREAPMPEGAVLNANSNQPRTVR